MKEKRIVILAIMALVLGCFAFGCGDDDDDTDTSGGDTDTDTDTDTDADGARGDTDASQEHLKGTVIGVGSDTPVPNLKVTALTNCDATPIAGQETTSGADGTAEFTDLPVDEEGLVGFKVDGVPNQFVDTYQFNLEGNRTDETLWSVDFATYTMAPALAGVEVDKTKAIAAGGLYFVDSQGNEHPVGCATVEPLNDEADLRYFGNSGMPAPATEQESVNPDNGYWIACNMTKGEVTLQAKVGEEVVGSTTFFAFDGEAISIGNIYVDDTFTENPGTCE